VASREQLEAYAALNDWYIDWTTTLRPSLTYEEQLQLGFVGGARRGDLEDVEDSDSIE